MPDASLPPPDVLQFHVLTAFPPHNVNRDEDGRPKTCQFGGVTRGRISSQAQKRALRFAPHFPGGQRATRTREAGILAFRRLTAAGIGREEAAWAALAVNFALGGGDKVPDLKAAKALVKAATDQKKIDEKMRKSGLDPAAAELRLLEEAVGTDQGLVVSTVEFARLEERLAELKAGHQADPAFLEGWVKSVCKDGLLSRADHDLDTALFGRMVAAKPDFNVEAAAAVGHAFTTHRFAVEGDYFSAGEELNELKGTGAAITSYAFFGGGVYYRHAVLDRRHLRETLSANPDADVEALVRAAVAAFVDGLVLAQPRGKRNSYASDVAASFVLVSRGADPALNLGLAFLDPVEPGRGEHDLMNASIERLAGFHRTLSEAYGLKNEVRRFNAYRPAPGELRTMEELRAFVGAAS